MNKGHTVVKPTAAKATSSPLQILKFSAEMMHPLGLVVLELSTRRLLDLMIALTASVSVFIH